jgi:hypothetical protein
VRARECRRKQSLGAVGIKDHVISSFWFEPAKRERKYAVRRREKSAVSIASVFHLYLSVRERAS